MSVYDYRVNTEPRRLNRMESKASYISALMLNKARRTFSKSKQLSNHYPQAGSEMKLSDTCA